MVMPEVQGAGGFIFIPINKMLIFVLNGLPGWYQQNMATAYRDLNANPTGVKSSSDEDITQFN